MRGPIPDVEIPLFGAQGRDKQRLADSRFNFLVPFAVVFNVFATRWRLSGVRS